MFQLNLDLKPKSPGCSLRIIARNQAGRFDRITLSKNTCPYIGYMTLCSTYTDSFFTPNEKS